MGVFPCTFDQMAFTLRDFMSFQSRSEPHSGAIWKYHWVSGLCILVMPALLNSGNTTPRERTCLFGDKIFQQNVLPPISVIDLLSNGESLNFLAKFVNWKCRTLSLRSHSRLPTLEIPKIISNPTPKKWIVVSSFAVLQAIKRCLPPSTRRPWRWVASTKSVGCWLYDFEPTLETTSKQTSRG